MNSFLKQWYERIPTLYSDMILAKTRAYSSDSEVVCPPEHLVFHALETVPPDGVKVVILGQDPYHHPGRANGLAFGYHPEHQHAPVSSLFNIMDEVSKGRTSSVPFDTTLGSWAKQGVLLLNTRLTVLAGKPLSHAYGNQRNISQSIGWEKPIQDILSYLVDQHRDVVWLLWGAEARRCATKAGVPLKSDRVITTSHPCKYSNTSGDRPFTGSRCFERANAQLEKLGKDTIQWLK